MTQNGRIREAPHVPRPAPDTISVLLDYPAGYRSAQASHLGNIAYLEKRRIEFDPTREVIRAS